MGRGGTELNYGSVHYPVGIYGWRKRCLYAFILFLMVIVIMNFALTVWIIRVLNFSVDGMGNMKITDHGLQLDGEAEFLKTIYVEDIKSLENVPLHIESSRNITLQARDERNKITNTFVLGNNKIESECEKFTVKDKKGKTRFEVSEDEVIMNLDKLQVSGSNQDMSILSQKESLVIRKPAIYGQLRTTLIGKIVLDGSIQTPTVRGPPSESLRLDSPTSFLKMSGKQGVSILSPSGNVEFRSADDLKFEAQDSSITLDAKTIFMKNVHVSDSAGGGKSYPNVYQLCICDNGRLFLAAPGGDCRATAAICR